MKDININIDGIKLPQVGRSLFVNEEVRIFEENGKIIVALQENNIIHRYEFTDIYEAYEQFLFFEANLGKTYDEILASEIMCFNRYSQNKINARVEEYKKKKEDEKLTLLYGGKTLFDFFF